MSNFGNKTVMAKNINKFMDLNGKTRNDICKDLGFNYTTFTDWVNGKTYPRIDKIEMLSNYFGIKKSDLVEDVKESESEFYLSQNEQLIAKEISTNPNVKVIYDATKELSQTDIDFVLNMIEQYKKTRQQ